MTVALYIKGYLNQVYITTVNGFENLERPKNIKLLLQKGEQGDVPPIFENKKRKIWAETKERKECTPKEEEVEP